MTLLAYMGNDSPLPSPSPKKLQMNTYHFHICFMIAVYFQITYVGSWNQHKHYQNALQRGHALGLRAKNGNEWRNVAELKQWFLTASN